MTDGDVGRALRFLGMLGAGPEAAEAEASIAGAGVVAGWLRETMAEGKEPEVAVVAAKTETEMEVEGVAESKVEAEAGAGAHSAVEGGEKGKLVKAGGKDGREGGEETSEGGPRKRQRQAEV